MKYLILLSLFLFSCSKDDADKTPCYACKDIQYKFTNGVKTITETTEYDTCMTKQQIDVWVAEGSYSHGSFNYETKCTEK